MQATLITQPSRPVSELIQQVRQGVLRRRVDEVANLVGLTDKEMARVLNMSVRSLHGKPPTDTLTLAAGERLLLFEALVQRALAVFDGRTDLVSRWLRTPLAELACGEVPNPENTTRLSTRQLGTFEPPANWTGKPSGQRTTDTDTSRSWGGVAQSPLAVLDTVSGFSLANDVLGRIEWGIIG